MDDLGYLTGEGAEGGDDEESPELFDAEFNPLDVLQQMHEQPQGGVEQPFDLLNARRGRGRTNSEVWLDCKGKTST